MSLWLSSRALMAPALPPWLEDLCRRLESNDPSLTVLELAHAAGLDDVMARALASSLRDNTALESVVLSCFSIVDDGAHAMGSALSSCPSLRRLQLRDLRNAREAVTLFRLLRESGGGKSGLRELSLRHCRICPAGAEALEQLLEHHGGLAEVRFVDCQFADDACFAAVCRGLAASGSKAAGAGAGAAAAQPPALQRVAFVNADVGPSRAPSVRHVLQNLSSLRELDLGENDLGDEGARVVAEGALRSTSLRALDLRSNGITPAGALHLQGVVAAGRHVASLRLGGNDLGNHGAAALARGLSSPHCVLRSLDVSDNGVDGAGCAPIAAMLRRNASLEELNLSFNPVGDAGARGVAAALRKNRKLRSLQLRRAGLTDAGAQGIAEFLPKMAGLKELALDKNGIGADGMAALAEALMHNVELERLRVSEPPPPPPPSSSGPSSRQIAHWVRLNRAGRRVFRHSNAVDHRLWPAVYARAAGDADLLYHFLKSKPEAASVSA